MKSVLAVILAAAAAWGQSAYTGTLTSSGSAVFGPGNFGDFFIAPAAQGGNDSNPCTLTQPCLTPQRGRAVVRGMPGGKHVVTLRGGTYQLSAPWTFDSGDSGTAAAATIVYQSYPSETAIISGGRKVGGTWTVDSSVNCGANCSAYYIDLDANPANQGHYVNFEALFYNGVRRPRPQARSAGSNHGYLQNACPNANNATMCVSGVAGGGCTGSPAQVASCQCSCPAGVTFCAFQAPPCSGGTPWMCFNKFMYSGTDIDGAWHAIGLGDIELLNFERWSMGRARLASASSGVASLTGPFALSDGSSGCLPGYLYLVENVKESAQKGQWYLDRCPGCVANATTPANTWRLYFFADTSIGENPNTGEVYAPSLDPATPSLITATGLQYVTFQGLTFEHDNWMPGAYGLGDSQGIPLVPAALSFTDSSNITFDSTIVGHIQGWGIEFLGASANPQIVNSAIYDVGAGGIRIGLHVKPTDTDTNVPRDGLVQNTAVAYYGRIQPTGEGPGIWLGDTHGNTITHNDIFGGYTGCVELGYGLNRGADDGSTTTQFFTYNNTVSWNHCYGQSSGGSLFTGVLSDFGGIYAASSLSPNCPTLGEPHLTPVNTYCNHILYNRIHDLVHNYDNSNDQGPQGIYLDQGTSAMEVRFNLVYRISHTCAFNNTPQRDGPNQYLAQWNLWENNIFANCGARQANRQRVVNRNGVNANSMTWRKNIGYYNSALGNFSYPQASPGHWGCFADDGITPVPCVTRFLFELNAWWNVAAGHALSFSTCKSSDGTGWPANFNLFSTLPWAGEDIGSIKADPLFLNTAFGVDDWYTQADLSPIGFQAWDYTQAGRTNPVISVPTSIPDLFPPRTVDASADY